MTYLFKCKCGARKEYSTNVAVMCPDCGEQMLRDFRAERAGYQTFTSALGDGKVQQRTVPSE